jgi:hypothetical protein
VDSKGVWARIAYMGMVIIQVMIALIPGEPFEIAAGYAFGALEGTVLFVAAVGLDLEVVYLEGQDGEPVDGPGGRFRVHAGIGFWRNLLELLQVIRVDVFHHIGAVLVGLVDSALNGKRLDRVYLRVADNVLEMPLNCVDPVLYIKNALYGRRLVWIVDRSINIVVNMIIGYATVENHVAVCRKAHKLYK